MEVSLRFWAVGGRRRPKSVPGGSVDAPTARPKRNPKGHASRGRGRSSLLARGRTASRSSLLRRGHDTLRRNPIPYRVRTLGPIDIDGLERGMSENASGPGAKPKVELFSTEGLRRRDGGFSPYPFGTRRILPLTASGRRRGDHSTSVGPSWSATKSGSRHARTMSVDWS